MTVKSSGLTIESSAAEYESTGHSRAVVVEEKAQAQVNRSVGRPISLHWSHFVGILAGEVHN
jgi:hypothetical protein